MRKGRARPLVALLLVVAGFAGACGSDEPAAPNATPSIDLSNVSDTEGRFAAHRQNQGQNQGQNDGGHDRDERDRYDDEQG